MVLGGRVGKQFSVNLMLTVGRFKIKRLKGFMVLGINNSVDFLAVWVGRSHWNSDMPLFLFWPEFPAAGAQMTDSSWFSFLLKSKVW